MKFQTLCSGSKGNCSLLMSDNANILIDLGMPLSVVEKDLESQGIKPQKIDAVFITHEHTDHICGVEAFSKKYGRPVYIHEKGFLEAAKKFYWTNHTLTRFTDGEFEFKGLKVNTYRCSHDSAYCCGYRFDDGKTAVATATDLGVADDSLVDFVEGCGLVLLESNHDEEMLRLGDYPYMLKRRVGGGKGHLSNTQAARLAVRMQKAGVRHILLGHLSQNNNTPETAFRTTVEELEKNGIVEGVDLTVDVVAQYSKSKVFRVGETCARRIL